MADQDPFPTSDYRDSHLQRGKSYDSTLASLPFDAYMAEMERIRLEEVVPQLFPQGIPRYLDFACGTGRITKTISAFAKEAFGVDISESMLGQAKEKCPAVQFVHADLTRDRKMLGQFDLVSSFRFFGNAQPELRESVLGALSEMVRPGGYLVVNNHRNPNSLANVLNRVTGGKTVVDLSYGLFRKILEDHGFRVERTIPIGVWLFRSALQETVAFPNAETIRRERMLGSQLFSPIAPDTIMVMQKV